MSCTDALLNYLNSGAGHAYFGAYDDAEVDESNPEADPFGRADEPREAEADVAEQIVADETRRHEAERSESEEERAHLRGSPAQGREKKRARSMESVVRRAAVSTPAISKKRADAMRQHRVLMRRGLR